MAIQYFCHREIKYKSKKMPISITPQKHSSSTRIFIRLSYEYSHFRLCLPEIDIAIQKTINLHFRGYIGAF